MAQADLDSNLPDSRPSLLLSLAVWKAVKGFWLQILLSLWMKITV
jgi:hypothetical protein